MKFKEAAGVLILFSAVTAAFFWPHLGTLGSSLIGPPEDNMLFYWFLDYGLKALSRADLPFMHTTQIYFPEGESLYYAHYYYYGIFAVWPLYQWVSGIFANTVWVYNLLVLHTFVFSGFMAYALLVYLTRDRWASLAGAYVFAFNPLHYAHSLHHITLASQQFIPWFVLFYLRFLRREGKRYAPLASVGLALSALSDWNFLVFSLIFAVLTLIHGFVKERFKGVGRLMFRFACVMGPALAMLSPLLVPMIRSGSGSSLPNLGGHDLYVADLLAFWVPGPEQLLHRLEGVQSAYSKLAIGNAWENAVYLGIIPFGVALFALITNAYGSRKFGIGLVVFMVLALGTRLHVLGREYPWPLPYELIESTPFLTQARAPARIMVFVYLFLAILVAKGIQKLLQSKHRFRSRLCAGFLVLLMVADYYSVSTHRTPVELPAIYRKVQEDRSGDFAILELPWDGARYMMYQTLHEIPSVQGYIGRRSGKALANRLEFDPRKLPLQRDQLTEHHVKYIIIFKKRLNWVASRPADVIYSKGLEDICKVYGLLYTRLDENDSAALFKVY